MVQDHSDPSKETLVIEESHVIGNEFVGDNGGGQSQQVSIVAGEEADGMHGEGNGSKDGLRHTGSKIANLRAAFEKQDDFTSPEGKRRFSRSPARGRDPDGDTAKLKEQYQAEVARIKEQQEVEIGRLKEQHQVETANLKKQLGREVEMRQAFEDKCTILEEQVEGLQGHFSESGSDYQAELERRTSRLQQERVKAQEEATNLQNQLYELKRGISTSTRIENEVSDSTFKEQFQHLYHETSNWVVNHFRKVKVEKTADEMCKLLETIAESKQAEYLKPVFQNFDSTIKLAALQATAVCYMIEIFDEALLYGLPRQQEWRRSIKKAAETLPCVLSPAMFNKWRSMTTDVIRQSESDEIKTSLESASKSMAEMICITLSTLTEAEESASRVSSLQAIIKRAISLSHLFRVQRARYEFRLPPPGTAFVAETMEDSYFADGDVSDSGPAQRFIRCSTFPSVVKLGDGSGASSEQSNVVVKAIVVCAG